jgi:hypothetical protein
MSATIRWRPASGGFELPIGGSTLWQMLLEHTNLDSGPIILDGSDLDFVRGLEAKGWVKDSAALAVAIEDHGEIFLEASW